MEGVKEDMKSLSQSVAGCGGLTSAWTAVVSICFCLRAIIRWSLSCWNITPFSCVEVSSSRSCFSSPQSPCSRSTSMTKHWWNNRKLKEMED